MVALAEIFHDEDFIRFRLPVSRGEQYYHVLLRRANCRTYAQPDDVGTQIERLERATMPPEFMNPNAEMIEAFKRFDTAPQ